MSGKVKIAVDHGVRLVRLNSVQYLLNAHSCGMALLEVAPDGEIRVRTMLTPMTMSVAMMLLHGMARIFGEQTLRDTVERHHAEPSTASFSELARALALLGIANSRREIAQLCGLTIQRVNQFFLDEATMPTLETLESLRASIRQRGTDYADFFEDAINSLASRAEKALKKRFYRNREED